MEHDGKQVSENAESIIEILRDFSSVSKNTKSWKYGKVIQEQTDRTISRYVYEEVFRKLTSSRF